MMASSWRNLSACVAGALVGSTCSAATGSVEWHTPAFILVAFLFCTVRATALRRREIALATFQQQAMPDHPRCLCTILPESTSFTLEAHEGQNVRAPRGLQ